MEKSCPKCKSVMNKELHNYREYYVCTNQYCGYVDEVVDIFDKENANGE